MYIGPHAKYPLFLPDFNETWIFWTDFWKILQYQISSKSIQWEQSCTIWTDQWADTMKLIVTFQYF